MQNPTPSTLLGKLVSLVAVLIQASQDPDVQKWLAEIEAVFTSPVASTPAPSSPSPAPSAHSEPRTVGQVIEDFVAQHQNAVRNITPK